MSNSLRDQLLQLGFKTAPEPEPRKKDRPGPSGARPHGNPRSGSGRHGKPHGEHARPGKGGQAERQRGANQPQGRAGKPRNAEMDLGKAYALRAQKEKEERIAAEREKQEAARLRREARAKLAERVSGKALNDPNAEVVRHFEYGGKIKRIYVTPEQLVALNAGQLGVLQLDGRYLLVDAGLLAEAETLFPPALALKVDPNAPAGDDPYADPKYQVPDDLVW